jgi:hypothetical protein
MGRFDGVRQGSLRRTKGGLGTCLALAVAVACGDGDGIDSLGALDARTTKVELAEFAGGAAARCVFSAPGLELCAWTIDPDNDAWAALAVDVETEGDVILLCELPLDGSPRAEASCRSHPLAVQSASGAGGLPPVGAAGSLENRRAAEQRLAEALTVRALSDLVGDVPLRCRTGPTAQTCEWSLAEGLAGYGLLAALVDDAGSGSTVRLRCVLPLDGAARSTDSCEAAWTD